ncbi:hypothetical protein BKA67DRAFT_668260 [Truncatella angustata]|uniref:Uncharacterized protein n=1 Tax=Truncatella angustata TaxID=152316 RepID=A0A9P8UZN1_9PEZI|nr:uncharacterized protein BKA67DRAFT_668260 [Truncatella angustata]KAH6661317.1 hypothetical protein BKA67DRAFT_668260 [Truncatella angustata]
MATVTVLADIHPALRDESSVIQMTSQVIVEEHLTPQVIAYAWSKHRYVLTPIDVEDILFEGCWGSVDDYITYMQDVNSIGELIPGTTNRQLSGSMRVYSHAEIEHMDGRNGYAPPKTVADPWVEPLPLYGATCRRNEVILENDRPPSFATGVVPPEYVSSAYVDDADAASTSSEVLEEAAGSFKAEVGSDVMGTGSGDGTSPDQIETHLKPIHEAKPFLHGRRVHFEAKLSKARRRVASGWQTITRETRAIRTRFGLRRR